MDNLSFLKNIDYFKKSCYLLTTVMFWPVLFFFYINRGLTFTEIALLQSIGAVVSLSLEIPSGYLADKIGDRVLLLTSVICRIFAVATLILSHNFLVFLIAEILFAIADSSQSGADQSFFYKNLDFLKRTEAYRVIMSKIRGRQSLIRIFVRLLAPLLFQFWNLSIFFLSIASYIAVLICYKNFNEEYLLSQTRNIQDDVVSNENKPINQSKNTSINSFFSLLFKFRMFIIISFLSLCILVVVSNYSQYLGPMLELQQFDISYFGIVLASGSLCSYLGSLISERIQTSKRSIYIFTLALMICFCLVGLGFTYGKVSGIVVYLIISILHTPFTVLLGEEINSLINNKYRATMLSINNLIDRIGTIIIDPVIGLQIDRSGFSLTYLFLGIGISVFILSLICLFLVFNNQVKVANGNPDPN